MNTETFKIDSFVFESRETYDLAKREMEIISKIKENKELSKPQNALKVYNRLVSEKSFGTIVGYFFLLELRNYLIQKGIGTAEALKEIQIKEPVKKTSDTLPMRPSGESRYKRLYELQKSTNVKYKMALVSAIIFLIGIVFITVQTKYSIFTYFTNYEEKMENEIIDKYEQWAEELKKREEALNNK